MRTRIAPTLRGMTWSHARGIDPLRACSELWQERTGVEVCWDARSLQDFESYPVRELATQYDLIVLDHPHVGQITREKCLLPLDVASRETECAALAANSVGKSLESYRWEGRLWALPIDAAAQVQCWRPDRLDAPLKDWPAVVKLASRGEAQCPLRPPHNLMSLFTLCGQLGHEGAVNGPDLIHREAGARAYEILSELIATLDPECFVMDPIALYEAMAQPDSRICCVPLIYGYVSYARQGFRARHIAFADIPTLSPGAPPRGSALGGTGIAISAFSQHKQQAIAFAYWVASADVQRGPYATGGGQPGNAAAWADAAVNEPVADFYRRTRATLEGAWVRPRHDCYMRFQHQAAEHLNGALQSQAPAGSTIDTLNELFRSTFRGV